MKKSFMFITYRFVLTLISILSFNHFLISQENTWQLLGPIYGEYTSRIVVDPDDDNNIICFSVGANSSENRGKSWKKFEIPKGDLRGFIVHNIEKKKYLVVNGSGVYRSIDAGLSWEKMKDGHFTVLGSNPLNNNTVYAGVGSGYIYKSLDFGDTWRESKVANKHWMNSILVSPTDTNIVFAGMMGDLSMAGDGLFKSTDGGISWESVLKQDIRCLVIDPLNTDHIYAGTKSGVYRSINEGTNWGLINHGFSEQASRTVVDLIFAKDKPHHLLSANFEAGIFETNTDQIDWRPIKYDYDLRILDLAIYNSDSTKYLIGTNFGLMEGTFINEPFKENHFNLIGANSVSVKSLKFHRLSPNRFIAYGRGIYISKDNGKTWAFNNAGLGITKILDLEINLNIPSQLFAAAYSGSLGGVYRSDDGGKTWTKKHSTNSYDVAIPWYDNKIIFSGGQKLLKSVDSGHSWDDLSAKVFNHPVTKIGINPSVENVIIVGTIKNGLFLSTDGGENWVANSDGLPTSSISSVREIKFDPVNKDIVYIAMWNKGVFKSSDGGLNWTEINDGLTNLVVEVLEIDPDNNEILYAGTNGNGVFKSDNGGVSWENILGDVDSLEVSGFMFRSVVDKSLFVSHNKGISKLLIKELSVEHDGGQFPNQFLLHQNYPNPFNPITTIKFDLPEVGDVTLTIYNILGQRIRTFDYRSIHPGFHSVRWDATNDMGSPVGAGVYLYQLRSRDFVKTRKLLLLK